MQCQTRKHRYLVTLLAKLCRVYFLGVVQQAEGGLKEDPMGYRENIKSPHVITFLNLGLTEF